VSRKHKKNKPNGGQPDPSQTNGDDAADALNGLNDLNGVSDDLSWVNGEDVPSESLDAGEHLIDPLADPDASGPEPEPEPEYEIPVSEARSSPSQMVAGTIDSTQPIGSVASRTSLKCHIREECEAEISQIWGQVFFAADHAPPRGIVVTAARKGDGATQISTSLAILGATSNKELRIALVDFNVRSARVAELMGLRGSPGLTDVLEGRATLEAALQAVSLPGGGELHVLTAGSTAAQPLALLRSRQLQSTLARLLDRYDHVIVDTPSINAFPDAKVVGQMIGGAVLVARAGQTPRETIGEAKKRLDAGGVKVLGLVLNQRTDPIPDALYQMI